MGGKFQATGVHKIHSYFSASGGVLSFYKDNASTQFAFGESAEGLDVKFFGTTASAYVLWDESLDTLEGSSGAALAWAGSASFAGVVDLSGSVEVAGAASFAGVVGMTGSVTLAGTTLFTGNIIASGGDTAINSASIKIANASTDRIGFYGATATTQQLKASNGNWASVDNVVGALVKLGLFDVS